MLRYILILLLILAGTSMADAQLRSYSNEFLSLGVGARALAMGNVQTATVSDVTAGFWNPAGLNHVENTQLGLMHAEWFAGIGKYDYLSIAKPLGGLKDKVGGISIIRFAVDDIPNTLYLVEPDGSVNYDNLTTFSAADYAALLSYAQEIKKFRVGLNVKVVHRRVGKFATSWGFGLDVGAQYDANENLTLGLTIKDLTTTVNAWSFNFTDEEQLALEAAGNIIPENSTELTGQRVILGAAYNVVLGPKVSLLTELDTDWTVDGKRNVLLKTDVVSMDPHIGMELNYDNFIYLRGGLNNVQQIEEKDGNVWRMQPNAGLGLQFRQVKLDYAFTGLNNLSSGIYSHIVSLIVEFK